MSRAVADAATQAMLSHAELNAYSDRVARVYTVIHQKLIAAGVESPDPVRAERYPAPLPYPRRETDAP
jgi:hypothetical protein